MTLQSLSVGMEAGRRGFDTTRWSLVLAVGDDHSSVARQALSELCETYWFPLYAYARRQGVAAEDAQDLIQSFFLLLLQRGDLGAVRPERGRFRSFLLASLRHFMAKRRTHERALKRGGGVIPVSLDAVHAEKRYLRKPADRLTPEAIYDRIWAVTLLNQVLERLGSEWEARGKRQEFDKLKACLMGDLPAEGYKEVARNLSTTEAAAKMAVQRLKRRFAQELRAAIADTVTDDAVDDELRFLLSALQP